MERFFVSAQATKTPQTTQTTQIKEKSTNCVTEEILLRNLIEFCMAAQEAINTAQVEFVLTKAINQTRDGLEMYSKEPLLKHVHNDIELLLIEIEKLVMSNITKFQFNQRLKDSIKFFENRENVVIADGFKLKFAKGDGITMAESCAIFVTEEIMLEELIAFVATAITAIEDVKSPNAFIKTLRSVRSDLISYSENPILHNQYNRIETIIKEVGRLEMKEITRYQFIEILKGHLSEFNRRMETLKQKREEREIQFEKSWKSFLKTL